MDGLQKIDGTQILGPASLQNRYPVVSFMLDGVHPHDVAQTLDSFGVAVRAGHHCAQPLMDRFDLDGTTRVSIAPYNDNTDIDALLTGVEARGERPCDERRALPGRASWRSPSRRPAPASSTAPTKSARRDNPLCGDRVTIDVRLDDSGKIAEIAHQVRGCLLCQASAVGAAPRLPSAATPPASPSCATTPSARSAGKSRRGARAVRRLRAGRRAQVAARMRAAAVRGPERRTILKDSKGPLRDLSPSPYPARKVLTASSRRNR